VNRVQIENALDEISFNIERMLLLDLVETLEKIANEDFRGNRPPGAVDAYNALQKFYKQLEIEK
jgi:hypothetical protein